MRKEISGINFPLVSSILRYVRLRSSSSLVERKFDFQITLSLFLIIRVAAIKAKTSLEEKEYATCFIGH